MVSGDSLESVISSWETDSKNGHWLWNREDLGRARELSTHEPADPSPLLLGTPPDLQPQLHQPCQGEGRWGLQGRVMGTQSFLVWP